MARQAVEFTYQDYLDLDDGKRYEILEGELMMTPAPSWDHQGVAARLFDVLNRHVKATGLGLVRFAPLDVILADTQVVQPDLLFIVKERLSIAKQRGVFGPPDLAVEILSPGVRERDATIKRRIYDRYGVREYWIADPENKTIEVLALGEQGLQTERVYPMGSSLRSRLLPGLTFTVDSVFNPD